MKISAPRLRRDHIGLEGFIWAIGVVEDRKDPLLLGRCKVRYFGWHTIDKAEMPTKDLPWTYPLVDLDHGRNVVGPKEGDWVLAFFQDGGVAQEPVMLGIFPGIVEEEAKPHLGFYDPRTSELSGHKVPRDVLSWPIQFDDGSGSIYEEIVPKSNYPQNERADGMLRYVDQKESTANRFERREHINQTIVEIKKHNVNIGQRPVPVHGHPSSGVGSDATSPGIEWEEKETPYKAKYPYNHAYFAESGHLIEVDDTPGRERLHMYHRSGTFWEVHPKGQVVNKIVDDEYHIVLKKRLTHIEAEDDLTVDWGRRVFVNKDEGAGRSKNYDVTIGKNGDYNLTIEKGNWNVFVQQGDTNVCINGNASVKITGDLSVEVGRNVNWSVMGNWSEVIFGNKNSVVIGSTTHHTVGNSAQTILGNHRTNVAQNQNLSVGKTQTIQVGGTQEQHVSTDKITKVKGETKYISDKKYYVGCAEDVSFKSYEKITMSAKKFLGSFIEFRLGLENYFMFCRKMINFAVISCNNIYGTLGTIAGSAMEAAGIVGPCFHDCPHGGAPYPEPPQPSPEPGVPSVTYPDLGDLPAGPQDGGFGGPGTGEGGATAV